IRNRPQYSLYRPSINTGVERDHQRNGTAPSRERADGAPAEQHFLAADADPPDIADRQSVALDSRRHPGGQLAAIEVHRIGGDLGIAIELCGGTVLRVVQRPTESCDDRGDIDRLAD